MSAMAVSFTKRCPDVSRVESSILMDGDDPEEEENAFVTKLLSFLKLRVSKDDKNLESRLQIPEGSVDETRFVAVVSPDVDVFDALLKNVLRVFV